RRQSERRERAWPRRRPKRSRRGGRTRALLATAVKPRIRTFIVLALVGLPLLVGVVLSQVTTDYLFFRELDQEDAFIRVQEVKALLVLVVGGFTASFLIG